MKKKIKLLEDWSGLSKDQIIEVDEETAKTLIDEGKAEDVSELDDVRRVVAKEVEAGLATATEKIQADAKSAIDKHLASIQVPKGDKAIAGLVVDPENKQKDSGGFKSFGEYLCSLRKAASGEMDSRLAQFKTAGHMEITEDSQGGFTVPQQFRNQLLMSALETAIMRPGSFVIPMTTNILKIPRIVETTHATSLFGGIVAYWLEERGTKIETKPEFGQLQLIAKPLTGYTFASDELLADNAVSLEALLIRLFGTAIAYYEDEAFIEGTGGGQPLGWMNSGALIAVTRARVMQVRYVDICNMFARMLPASLMNAIWICNPMVLPQLFQMVLGTHPVYIPNSAGATVAPAGTLFGRPLYVSEKMQSLGTQGDLAFIDRSYYVIGDRQGLKIDSSIHVAFATNETCWRFVQRVDGQAWVDDPLHPKHGTDTLSPFIVLSTTGSSTTTS